MKRFIIWNPASHLPPRVVFDSRKEAERVAGEMAERYYPAEFIVCELRFVARWSKIPHLPVVDNS